MIRTGNFELAGTHYTWVSDFEVARETNPEWALTVERMGNGRFYGTPKAFLLGEAVKYEARPDGSRHALLPSPESMAKVAEGPEAAWAKFEEFHDDVRERWERRVDIEKDENGEVNARIEEARFAVKKKDLDLADDSLRELAVKVVDGRLERELWEARRRAAEETAAKERAAGREPAPFTDPEPSGPRLLAEDGVRLERWRAEMDAMLVARREEHAVQQQAERDYLAIRDRIDELNAENARYVLLLETADGQEKRLTLDEIVRAYPANRLGTGGRLGVYASRWGEFLGDEPRESNMEGGVLPAIFGTVVMTLIMSLIVVPFGVMAALYLREYAKPGPLVSIVRIAINNLAGVPSIVFGVFGLGFFCYTIGAGIDELLFAERLPSPTYGTGGLLWASLTLALLTLPVVIVATEEALSAVPRSMREGSYACGASKWQTIRRIVLPRAMPGIMTGMILAIARGAGEVAPLMLVGAVKLAPQMPVDGEFPFLHAERSFMHLGFHIYDLGFQSSNSEAAKPMVFTTTLLLIGIVVLLNVVAIWVRSRLRRKFSAGQA
jgi:phosphate transport system permease protein